jgi:5'-nucleotidase
MNTASSSQRRILAALACALMLAACASPTGHAPATLTIAHINDHHAHLDPQPGFELRLDGVPTQVELGGFARLTALFAAQRAATPALLQLHAGDAMTGTLHHTLFRGEADARLMNTVCFDAFVPGNHEFDDGDAALARFIAHLQQPGECPRPTEVLAANIVPAPGTPLAPAGRSPLMKPWTVREVGGLRVGLIGIDIASKTRDSSRPLPTTVFRDEVASARAAVDALRAQGIRHIVLLTHQGLEADRLLAAALPEVDAIIGGDSHTLLGDFSEFGIPSAGSYPQVARNLDGDPVCIGQAWEYGKVFARMDLRFDARGAVTQCAGQAALVLGEALARREASGRSTPLDDHAARALRTRWSQDSRLRFTAPDAAAEALLATYRSRIEAQKAQVIGQAPEALCLVRVPGERTPRSGGIVGCEQASQQARGSDVAQAVAEAFLEASPRADVALQNAGGVRTPVPAGPLTMDTAFTVLPYANTLVEIRLSGAELAATLEDAVAHHLDARQSDGAHPYAAGLRWRLDMRRPRGQRFSDLEVQDRHSGQWSALAAQQHYVLVTSDYLAAGKDGHVTLARLAEAGRATNTYLLYTQTLADHIRRHGGLNRQDRARASHQQVITAEGRLLD